MKNSGSLQWVIKNGKKQIPKIIKFVKFMCFCKPCRAVQTENMVNFKRTGRLYGR